MTDTPSFAALRTFTRNPVATAALLLLLMLAFSASFAPWLAPQNPYDLTQLDILDARLPPATEASANPRQRYWLGTDEQGRDIGSAILYGLRTSIVVSDEEVASATTGNTVFWSSASPPTMPLTVTAGCAHVRR